MQEKIPNPPLATENMFNELIQLHNKQQRAVSAIKLNVKKSRRVG